MRQKRGTLILSLNDAASDRKILGTTVTSDVHATSGTGGDRHNHILTLSAKVCGIEDSRAARIEFDDECVGAGSRHGLIVREPIAAAVTARKVGLKCVGGHGDEAIEGRVVCGACHPDVATAIHGHRDVIRKCSAARQGTRSSEGNPNCYTEPKHSYFREHSFC